MFLVVDEDAEGVDGADHRTVRRKALGIFSAKT